MAISESCSQHNGPEEGICADLCREYERLLQRHKQLMPKGRRLRRLARPKYPPPKRIEVADSCMERKTEIIRDPRYCTRTEQLALPPVVRMVALKQLYSDILEPARVGVVNRTLRKAMLSLYSRLANYQAPGEKKPPHRWTKKRLAAHNRHLVQLSKPKKMFYPPKQVSIWKDISLMKRFLYLCKPKMREVPCRPEWTLSAAQKKYKASERILLLAKPKERDENVHFQPLPIPINPEAMTYKASERIKQLATAPEVRLGESDLKENPFGIAPNALKGKASERVVELSQPKEFQDTHTRPNPFAISPAALKAKATPRTLELAKPKGT